MPECRTSRELNFGRNKELGRGPVPVARSGGCEGVEGAGSSILAVGGEVITRIQTSQELYIRSQPCDSLDLEK